MNAPSLTDRTALALHRRRALGMAEPALFLHEEAILEVEERLLSVNRTFADIAIITGFPDLWRSRFPGARIVPDALVLDLEEQEFDLVIHALALHWADDPVGQLVQCRRALRPDGLLLALSLGGQTLHELRTSLAEAEVEVTGGLSPRVVPMGEIRDMGALLHRAGFALPVADSLTRTVSYRDAFHLMADLRGMGETNALAARRKSPATRRLFLRMAEVYAQSFGLPDGRIRATFELLCLTGWAPHDSQQKPLRPGSAQQRLADALKVAELRLPGTSQDG